MSDANEIKIIEYNDIDSISLNIPDNVTNIAMQYENNVGNIDVQYTNEIENIILTLGMSDANEIKIIEYNDIDSISLNIPDNVTNIAMQYENNVGNIDVQYTNEIENIILTLGPDSQTVFSVNNLFGNVNLTEFQILSSVSASSGIYSYTISHNLEYSLPIIALYNTNDELVFADIKILNSNSVRINSVMDLDGYKVVMQR